LSIFGSVLTADVRFEGWTAEDWRRFLHLWKPQAVVERDAGRPLGGLFVVHDGARLRKVLHTVSGRVDPREAWPVPLKQLAEAHRASWIIAAHAGALDELMERFGARARRGDDLTTQALSLVGLMREMMAEGAIDSWPRRLRGVPTPTDAMVRRALDSVCSDGHAILLGMFQDGELWTAFVARRRGNAFDVLAGPDELRPAMGLLSGDWRRDYRHLVRVVEEQYAELALGCFAEVETFRALQVDGRAGAWGRAVAVRDLVVSPMPTAIGLAIGVDGVRYAFEGMRVITNRIDPLGLLEPMLRRVRKRLGPVAGEHHVSSVLGFDPMAALRALLKR
jgi:hypothetical protein